MHVFRQHSGAGGFGDSNDAMLYIPCQNSPGRFIFYLLLAGALKKISMPFMAELYAITLSDGLHPVAFKII